MKKISQSLSQNKHLKILNLSSNQICEVGITDLLIALLSNSTLTSLNLSKNELFNDSLKMLLDFLSNNRTLRELDISFNSFKLFSKNSISQFLSQNSTLTGLNLKHNKLKEICLKYLPDSLKTNSTLKKLYLDEISFQDKQLKKEIKVLVQNNQQWNPTIHSSLYKAFRVSIFTFLLCLKVYQKICEFKVPKYMLFDIIRRTEIISFYKKWDFFLKKKKL